MKKNSFLVAIGICAVVALSIAQTPVVPGNPPTGAAGGVLSGTYPNPTAGPTLLTTAGGQTLAAANTLTGLPSGCTQYPCVVVPEVVLLNQTADLGVTTLLASAPAGQYELLWMTAITTAATTSSTLSVVRMYCNDPTDSLDKSILPGITPATGNNTSTAQGGALYCDVKAGTNVRYYTAQRATSGATPMAFKISVTLIRVG